MHSFGKKGPRRDLRAESIDTTGERHGLEALSLEPEETFDPYNRKPVEKLRRPKRDLRKLSAWITMMRELEERKLRDDEDE